MNFFDKLKAETEQERQQLFSIPIIQDALQGSVTTGQYIAFLTQAYHHVRHTVPLMMACGSRLDERHEWLRQAIAEYIEEEIGHQEWILNDIAACGGDAAAARASRPHASTELMVAYAYHQVDRGNPVAFFGMVHVLEGTSISIADKAAARSVSRGKLNSVSRSLSSASPAFACPRLGLSGIENSRASNTPNMPVDGSYPAAVIRLPSGRR